VGQHYTVIDFLDVDVDELRHGDYTADR
jgi:hypothetical protein